MVSTVDDVLKSSVRVDCIVSMSSEDLSVNVILCNDTCIWTHLRKGRLVDRAICQTTPFTTCKGHRGNLNIFR